MTAPRGTSSSRSASSRRTRTSRSSGRWASADVSRPRARARRLPPRPQRARPARRPDAQDAQARAPRQLLRAGAAQLLEVDLLMVGDFGLDGMDPIESRDAYD